MKTKYLVMAIVAMTVFPLTANAQWDNELGTWTSLSVKKNFTPKFNLTFREELRTNNNIRNIDLFFFRLSANFKATDWLSLALAYDNLSTCVGASQKGNLAVDGYTKNANRLLVDIGGTYKPGRWNLNLRERYVYSYTSGKDVAAMDEDGMYETWSLVPGSSHLLRSKLTVTYNIKDSKWSPYLGPEFFNSLNSGDKFKLSQIRWYAGVTFKVDKVNTFKFFYCCQSKYTNHKNVHAIGLDYIITLP